MISNVRGQFVCMCAVCVLWYGAERRNHSKINGHCDSEIRRWHWHLAVVAKGIIDATRTQARKVFQLVLPMQHSVSNQQAMLRVASK